MTGASLGYFCYVLFSHDTVRKETVETIANHRLLTENIKSACFAPTINL